MSTLLYFPSKLNEEVTIERSTNVDKSFTAVRSAMFNSSVGGAIGSTVGGAVGGALGFVFGAKINVGFGIQYGIAIGGAIGSIGGSAKGVKDGLEQVKDKDKAIAVRGERYIGSYSSVSNDSNSLCE